MRSLLVVLGCLSMIGVAGCGGGGPDNNVVIKKDYDAANSIKEVMEGVKTSGRIGSNFSGVMNALADLKAKDAAKGATIETLLNEITALKDPAKVKAKAEEILKSL